MGRAGSRLSRRRSRWDEREKEDRRRERLGGGIPAGGCVRRGVRGFRYTPGLRSTRGAGSGFFSGQKEATKRSVNITACTHSAPDGRKTRPV